MLNAHLIDHISEHDARSIEFAVALYLIATISIVVFVAWFVTDGFRPRSKDLEKKPADPKRKSD